MEAQQPSGASILLEAWGQAVNEVLTWIEEARCDRTGFGDTPSDALQRDQDWRGEQNPGGRLSGLVGLASRAKHAALAAGTDAEPAKDLIELLQGRNMPSVAALTTATTRVKRELEQIASANHDSGPERFQERPERVTREYVVEMLEQIYGDALPMDMLSPLVDYLLRKKVLERHNSGLVLPQGQGDLATFPEDAVAALRRAVIAHANTDSCPEILRSSLSLSSPRAVNRAHVERVLWNRPLHVRALQDFGWSHADRVFEILTYRMVGKPVPPPEQPEPDDRSDLEQRIGALTISSEQARKVQAQRAARAAKHRQQLLDGLEPSPDLLRSANSPLIGAQDIPMGPTTARRELEPAKQAASEHPQVSSRAAYRLSDDERVVLEKHCEAVQAGSGHAYVSMMHSDSVTFGMVLDRLNDDQCKTFRGISGYCQRWRDEGGPHEDTRPRQPIGGDLYELNKWRQDRSGHAELLDWDHQTIKLLRGRWAGVLNQLLEAQGGHEPEPAQALASRPSPPVAPTSSTPSPPLDPTIEWVSASSLVDETCRDASAVRRFCVRHNIRMHSPKVNRRLVDAGAYRSAKKKITRQAEQEVSGIAERREAEARRKRLEHGQ